MCGSGRGREVCMNWANQGADWCVLLGGKQRRGVPAVHQHCPVIPAATRSICMHCTRGLGHDSCQLLTVPGYNLVSSSHLIRLVAGGQLIFWLEAYNRGLDVGPACRAVGGPCRLRLSLETVENETYRSRVDGCARARSGGSRPAGLEMEGGVVQTKVTVVPGAVKGVPAERNVSRSWAGKRREGRPAGVVAQNLETEAEKDGQARAAERHWQQQNRAQLHKSQRPQDLQCTNSQPMAR
jgi:hypothetical protein